MRLDELAERMGESISIETKSFLLRPQTSEREREKFAQYTQSWMRPAEMEPRAEFNVWSSDSPAPSGSIPAQVAAKAMTAWRPELAHRFDRALLTAYFTDNRTISDLDVLADIAAECGADRDTFKAFVVDNEQQFTQQVIDEHNQAVEQGITAVPTVVIDGVLPVQGAQDVDLYEHWIRKIIERRSAN